jgi:hypothetical protein
MVTNMNTRRAAHAWAMGLFLSFMTAASGCYIQHGGDAPWDDEAPPSVGICSDLCDHLQGCNLVEGEAWQACVDGCNAQHVSTPYLVETGAACVIDAGCAPLDTYDLSGRAAASASAFRTGLGLLRGRARLMHGRLRLSERRSMRRGRVQDPVHRFV